MNGKIIYCNQSAKWLSPKRLHTTGRLKVCNDCREKMREEYRQAGRQVIFERLEIKPLTRASR